MKKYKSTQKGFTLIELLMVIALIAILSTMILIMLDSGAERASVNKYLAYGTQVHKLVADAVAAGKFDKSAINPAMDADFCLGDYPAGACGTLGTALNDGGDSTEVYEALTYLGDLPPLTDGQGFSPFDATEGVSLTIDRPNDNLKINLYLLNEETPSNRTYIDKTCASIGWTRDGERCYINVPLHSRL